MSQATDIFAKAIRALQQRKTSVGQVSMRGSLINSKLSLITMLLLHQGFLEREMEQLNRRIRIRRNAKDRVKETQQVINLSLVSVEQFDQGNRRQRIGKQDDGTDNSTKIPPKLVPSLRRPPSWLCTDIRCGSAESHNHAQSHGLQNRRRDRKAPSMMAMVESRTALQELDGVPLALLVGTGKVTCNSRTCPSPSTATRMPSPSLFRRDFYYFPLA
jgi:hypothetical protein